MSVTKQKNLNRAILKLINRVVDYIKMNKCRKNDPKLIKKQKNLKNL